MPDLPQLNMKYDDITNLPSLVIPDGFSIHTHTDDLVPVWEHIVEEAFKNHFSFEQYMKDPDFYNPEHIFYIKYKGEFIATATATERAKYPGLGLFHMIATLPSAKGLGAGRLACMAALHSLAKQGYKTAVLSTDDFRLPAICLYLSLGFKPWYRHESHEERWNKILESLKK